MSYAYWCCCGQGEFCSGSCFDQNYALTAGLNGSVNYSLIPKPFAQQVGNCCGAEGKYYNMTLSFSPLGQVQLNRVGRTAPCCYTANFTMRVTGSFNHGWDFNTGSPSVNCQYDSTINFQEDVAAQYEVCCIGNQWHHRLHICHFNITCNDYIQYSDCEVGACQDIPVSFGVAGAVYYAVTDLIDPNTWTAGSYRFFNLCGITDFCCANALPIYLTDYDLIWNNAGAGAWWGVYTREECSEQDPYLPCDDLSGTGYGIWYRSYPYIDGGESCTGGEVDLDLNCYTFERNQSFTWGTWV